MISSFNDHPSDPLEISRWENSVRYPVICDPLLYLTLDEYEELFFENLVSRSTTTDWIFIANIFAWIYRVSWHVFSLQEESCSFWISSISNTYVTEINTRCVLDLSTPVKTCDQHATHEYHKNIIFTSHDRRSRKHFNGWGIAPTKVSPPIIYSIPSRLFASSRLSALYFTDRISSQTWTKVRETTRMTHGSGLILFFANRASSAAASAY
jgi:hypothetical protein